jgi:hypothetical protein
MTSEAEWVEGVAERMKSAGQLLKVDGIAVGIGTGTKLPYSYEVLKYEGKEPLKSSVTAYETDLLIYDQLDAKWWVPRVVVECKLKKVTSHDALTYDAKAATHKNVHPYLRYGVLIGARSDNTLPVRLFRHGDHFDFMITWAEDVPSPAEWESFLALITEEIKVSRKIQELSSTSHSPTKPRYSTIHRQLRFK